MESVLLHHIKQYIHRIRKRKQCSFGMGVTIDSRAQFEGGNVLADGTTFLSGSLGYGSYIRERCWFENTRIGRYCCIASDVSIVAGSHPLSQFVSVHPAFYSTRKQSGFTYVDREKYNEYKWVNEEKRIMVDIGNDVWIGVGAKIMEGLTIGDGAVIAAGAVVTKDVPPYAIVAGVPAKILRYRFDEETIRRLLAIRWWDRGEAWLREHAEQFENAAEFVKMWD